MITVDPNRPDCAHPGCKNQAHELCLASCCADRTALCAEHSHRARLVLDTLGFPIGHFKDAEPDVLGIIQKLWMGAALVIENRGYFELERRLRNAPLV